MKNTREVTQGYRIAHWIEKMQARSASGLSIKGYCEREGIHPNVYYYWQRKLRELAVSEMQPKETEIAQLPPGGWTELTAIETKKSERCEVTIEIGKSRVLVKDSTDTELLTKECKVLVELC